MLTAKQELVTRDQSLNWLQTEFRSEMEQVNDVIISRLASPVGLIAEVGEYLLQAGGKRLRPLLTIACSRLFNPIVTRAIPLAAAVELMHTATLLHDDVVDESDLRRGQKTTNQLWGNQASILVGDFLFARAFQLMVEDKDSRVLSILSNAAASIVEGELQQLSACHNLKLTAEDSLKTMANKTAVLFAAACQVGGISSGVDEESQALYDYGFNLGMVFQITDDILDYNAKQNSLGKVVGDDFREGKITLPVIFAYQSSQEDFWHRCFVDVNQKSDDWDTILDLMHKTKAFDKCYDLANDYAMKAKEALKLLPTNSIQTHLYHLVDCCYSR